MAFDAQHRGEVMAVIQKRLIPRNIITSFFVCQKKYYEQMTAGTFNMPTPCQ